MITSRDTRAPAEQVSPQRLRSALANFASGVTVVTTAGGSGTQQVHGMTANAFTSVSLEPPLVLVSVSNTAHLQERILQTGRYGISILSREQEAFARHFAGQSSQAELVRFVWRDGLPLVDGALAHLTCTVLDSHLAGDHTLHVARVDTVTHEGGAPLVYHRGSFSGLDATEP